jgi:hypothetical protein
MTVDEAVAAFSALTRDRQIAVMTHYSFNMTIIARRTYIPGTEGVADPQRLRFLNELQHRVMGHICVLLNDDIKRYDDDAIVRIVVADEEEDEELLSAFAAAIRRKDR